MVVGAMIPSESDKSDKNKNNREKKYLYRTHG